MNRSTIILVAAAAIGLAACSGGQAGSSEPDITVNTGENQTGISVSGVGEVTGTPDTLSISLGVSVRADTVSEASALAAEKAEAVISSLTSNGVDNEDITTTNYSIWPEYEWRNDTQILVGYRVDNTVQAKIRDIEGGGDVLDAAVEAGGDEVRVNGLSFSIEDDSEMIEAARQVAWDNAFQKATQLAELSGQTLGPATSINETFGRPPTPIAFDSALAAEEGADRATTPVEPGTSTITVNIQVQFSLGS